MDLIDRYLHAVKGHLPTSQHDVVVELADDLRSRIEDREAELGRPLTEREVATMLKALGRPMVFASRYLKQQALIGPALLPYYWQVLKVSAAIALLVQVVVAIVMLAAGRPVGESLKGIYLFPFTTLPFAAGWITLVFAIMERYVSTQRITDSWDPMTLPAVGGGSPGRVRVGIVGDLIGLAITLAWWLAVRAYPFLLLGPISTFIGPGPGWQAAYLPVAVLMLVAMGGHAVALARPALRRRMRIVGHLCALTGLALLWGSGDLLVPTGVPSPPALAHGVEVIDRYASAGVGVIAALTFVELARDLWRLAQARPPHGAPADASSRPASPR
jgi:hypothetical protein